MSGTEQREIRVWDPLVRIGHWLLVAAFVVAYLTEGEPMLVHSWAGYVIAGYVLLRLLWGFVGPREARFAAFLYRPGEVLGYLADLLRFRAKRHLGHSPAGGVMVIALLLSLAATVTTGMLAYGDQDHAGPLAFLFPAPATPAPAADQPLFPSLDQPDGGQPSADGRRRPRSELVGVHEVFVNLTLVLVILHIAGVILASVAHRENLARAMVTGRKRAE